MKLIKPSIVCILSLFVVMACSDNASQSAQVPTQPQAVNYDDFIGCYAIVKDNPAVIKIIKDGDHLAMQMKENNQTSPWDTPEPLAMASVDEIWKYYAVNTLDLQKSQLTHAIKRADNMLVLAKVDGAAKNINPLLDSDYVAYVFAGSNTIYKVACDDVPMDLLHAESQPTQGAKP